MIICKALYGLQFSGKMFGELVFEILSELGFTPSKAEPQIWMREANGKYEYVATYVDDLLLAMDDPKSFIDLLTSLKYNLKFKGTREVDFHLGANFCRDQDGTLFMSPKRYIERIAETYKRFFGEKPPKFGVSSPLESNDHLELDTSELLGDDDIQKYRWSELTLLLSKTI